ncbi:MAG: hypothetical protein Q9187_006268 [Circinaria calcarea]
MPQSQEVVATEFLDEWPALTPSKRTVRQLTKSRSSTPSLGTSVPTSPVSMESVTLASTTSEVSKFEQGPLTLYPVPVQKLRGLQTGPKINVFVDERSCHDLVFNVPQSLLTYFSPVLHHSLQTKADGPNVVVLQHTDKKTASWVLSWMIGGGKTVPAAISPRSTANSPDDIVDILLRRLQIVFQLDIVGKLEATLLLELEQALQKSSVLSGNWVHWIYSHTSSVTAPRLRDIFATSVINTVLNHDLAIPSSCPQQQAVAHAGFRRDLTKGLSSPKTIGRIRGMQQQRPLSVSQVRFIFTFAASKYLRKAVAQDLLALIDDGKVNDEQAYRDYAWENTEFEDEMSRAIDAKARRTAYLEREAARQARVTVKQYHSKVPNVRRKASVLPSGRDFQSKLTPAPMQIPTPVNGTEQTGKGTIAKSQRRAIKPTVANKAMNNANNPKVIPPNRVITFESIAPSGPAFSFTPARGSNQRSRKAQIETIINADTGARLESASSTRTNPTFTSPNTGTNASKEIPNALSATPKLRTRVPPETRKIKTNPTYTTRLQRETTSQLKPKPTPTNPSAPAPAPKPRPRQVVKNPEAARRTDEKKETKRAEAIMGTAKTSPAKAKIDSANMFRVLEDSVDC